MRLQTVICGSRVLHGRIVSRQTLRLGQGLVGSRPVYRLINIQTVGCLALVALFAGCGSEQSPGPRQAPAPAKPAVEVMETPVPVATEPALEPVAASDPLSLDTAPLATGGVVVEESVDDILAKLNAIKLEDDGGKSLGDPDKVVALMHEGNALISAGRPDAALARYKEALEFAEDGEDSEVFFNMGIAYKAKGELAKAAAEYERALELTPQYAEALNNLGNIRKDQKKYDEAIAHLESSIKVFPGNPKTHNNLGTVYGMKGNVNKAALYFAKAVRLKPSYIDARQNLGQAYQEQGRLDVAEKEFGEVLQITRGMMLRQKKRLEAARVMVDQAKKPGSPLTFEQRNNAGGELDAAEQASRMANAKYQRSLKLLQSVRVRR
jgi:tetratricopeptide (TPR) repeat protein